MFNVSMNPFRRITEKRRQNSTNFEGHSFFGLSKSKHPKFDPEFSVDNFLSRLQSFRQQQNSIQDKPILPPKPSSLKNSTNQLSTKCFVEIFKRLPAKDLLNLRFVCKEFNQIIQNHALELDTVLNENVQLFETTQTTASNNSYFFIRSETNRNSSKLQLEEIDRPLRHLKTDILDLNGITVTQKALRYLLRSFKYQISKINFNECKFLISADKFARLINPWKPESLEFTNCSWNFLNDEIETNFDQLFINFFFSRHQRLDSLIIDFSKMPKQKLEISDKISQIFNDSTKLPSTLIFKNCSTNITAKTLHNAIWAYIEAKNFETTKLLPKYFNWSFGEISDSEDIVISMLKRFSKFILTEKFEKSRLEIIFQIDSNFPNLHFCVEFENSDGFKIEDEEGLSDIEWDDSMDSDAFILSSENTSVEKVL